MNEKERARLTRELRDREEILRCVTAYCRAVDRIDRELLLRCYHDDAIDDHGVVRGTPVEFADWVAPHIAREAGASHMIANHHCDIDGDVAHAETYFVVTTMRHSEPKLVLTGGRYIDRFERRDGRWAIAARKVLKDWWGQPGDSNLTGVATALVNRSLPPARDRSDPSYHRPLVI